MSRSGGCKPIHSRRRNIKIFLLRVFRKGDIPYGTGPKRHFDIESFFHESAVRFKDLNAVVTRSHTYSRRSTRVLHSAPGCGTVGRAVVGIIRPRLVSSGLCHMHPNGACTCPVSASKQLLDDCRNRRRHKLILFLSINILAGNLRFSTSLLPLV